MGERVVRLGCGGEERLGRVRGRITVLVCLSVMHLCCILSLSRLKCINAT